MHFITFYMRKFLSFILIALFAIASFDASAKRVKFDYGTVYVPEEGGSKFEKITEDADCVNGDVVFNNKKLFGKNSVLEAINWWVNPQIALSKDGSKIAYRNFKNGTSNIMVKNATKGGASTQRTFRSNVTDFTWSPDDKNICFTEVRNGHFGIYLVDAYQGNVVHQISNGNDNDFAGQITPDGNTIYFHRGEGNQNYTIWSYDAKKNLFSNYSRGMTPVLIPGNNDVIYVARYTDKKESEIWRINLKTGVEEIILSVPGRSFTTPQLSPNKQWILVTGSSISEKEQIINTDLYVVRTDGSGFTQLTFHPGNDLSGIWSKDGKSIYFLSNRGSADQVYNVWKMDFNL